MSTSSRFTTLQQPIMTRQSASNPSHLLAAYSFDTYDGSDASGRGNTLVSQGAGVSFGAGVNKNATYGTGDMPSACWAADPTNLQPAQVTFMAWVNMNTTQTGDWICAFGLHQAAATWPIWGIYPQGWGTGPIVFGSNITGGENLEYSTPSSIYGAWHHIAGSFDGTTKSIFFDGELGSTATVPGTFDYSSVGQFHVLGDPNYNTSRMYAGGIDDVRVYDTALTQAQIQTCMNTAVGTKADPVVS